jgi:SAM-dependent methyltransferase
MDTKRAIRLHRHQAEWTRPMRRELYRRARLAVRESVLDLGCGDGLITREMAGVCRGRVVGVDVDPAMIAEARRGQGIVEYIEASARDLPFDRACFELVTGHWFFMWLDDPSKVLKEIKRVLKPGGTLLAACEPDYGGRVVHPEEAELKDDLIRALTAQGADPMVGRKLPGLFRGAGFAVRCGLYQGVWDASIMPEALEREAHWLRSVLAGHAPENKISSAVSALYKARDLGSLFMFNPVIWTMGS